MARNLDGFSHEETAEILGNPDAVRLAHFRAHPPTAPDGPTAHGSKGAGAPAFRPLARLPSTHRPLPRCPQKGWWASPGHR